MLEVEKYFNLGVCGKLFFTSWDRFKHKYKRQCDVCGKKTWTIDLINKELLRITKGEYMVISKNYINGNTPIELIHNKCNSVYSTKWRNFYYQGSRCPKCSYELRAEMLKKSHDEFSEDLKVVYGNGIIAVEYYKGCNLPIKFKNLTTGIEFTARPSTVLGRQSMGISYSVGEHFIYNYLKTNRICFKKEFSFYGLKSQKNKLLRFDFAVFLDESQEKPEFLIEYDGIQHFEPREVFGGQEQFEKQQLHDRMKDDYCKQNGIELIRIPYREQDNIEEILTEKLCSLIEGSLPEKQHCLSL